MISYYHDSILMRHHVITSVHNRGASNFVRCQILGRIPAANQLSNFKPAAAAANFRYLNQLSNFKGSCSYEYFIIIIPLLLYHNSNAATNFRRAFSVLSNLEKLLNFSYNIYVRLREEVSLPTMKLTGLRPTARKRYYYDEA